MDTAQSPSVANTVEVRPLLKPRREICTIMNACTLAHVSRRTIYNWLESGKLEYVRTASGSVRIFVDSLLRAPGAPRG